MYQQGYKRKHDTEKKIAWTMWDNGSELGPVSRKSRKLFGPENKYLNRNIKDQSASPG